MGQLNLGALSGRDFVHILGGKVVEGIKRRGTGTHTINRHLLIHVNILYVPLVLPAHNTSILHHLANLTPRTNAIMLLTPRHPKGPTQP